MKYSRTKQMLMKLQTHNQRLVQAHDEQSEEIKVLKRTLKAEVSKNEGMKMKLDAVERKCAQIEETSEWKKN